MYCAFLSAAAAAASDLSQAFHGENLIKARRKADKSICRKVAEKMVSHTRDGLAEKCIKIIEKVQEQIRI